MSHTFFPWDEEIAILALKADEWLMELEKLEANMLWAWVCVGSKKRGIEPCQVPAGCFSSRLTGNRNQYAAGEGRCCWHLESPDGKIVLSGEEPSQGMAFCS